MLSGGDARLVEARTPDASRPSGLLSSENILDWSRACLALLFLASQLYKRKWLHAESDMSWRAWTSMDLAQPSFECEALNALAAIT